MTSTRVLVRYCFTMLVVMTSVKSLFAESDLDPAVSCLTVTVHVNEATSSVDNATCLKGLSNCKTIDYVLLHLPNCSEIIIASDQSMSMIHNVVNKHQVTIRGIFSERLSIEGNITFISCTDIQIAGLSIIITAYSIENPDSKLLSELQFNPFEYNISEYSSITFVNSSHVNISHCYFESFHGIKRALMFFNLTGENVINSSVFNGSNISGGISMLQKGDHFATSIIDECCFFDNKAQYGGALQILIIDSSPNNKICVKNSHFESNHAEDYGGHVDIVLKGNVESTAIVLTNTNFTFGYAMYGGVASINVNMSSGAKQAASVIQFIRCNFDNNSSEKSGVVEYIQYDNNNNIFVHFTSCYFCYNTANQTSTINAVLDLSYDNVATPNTDLTDNLNNIKALIFEDCKWYYNGPPREDIALQYHFGSIYAVHIPLYFNGSTTISHTYGPAITLIDTLATFAGNVLIEKCGRPVYGSGILMNGESLINLRKGVKIVFNAMEATYGGSIFSEFSLQENTKSRILKPCIFIYEGEQRNSNVSTWTASVSFNDTKSIASGNAMYLRNSEICSKSVVENMFFNNSVFSGLNVADISSSAVNINFSEPGIERYQFENLGNKHAQFQVMLGQKLKFNASVLDILNNPTQSIVIAAYLDCPHNVSRTHFNSPTAFSFLRGVHLTNVNLEGSKVISKYTCEMELQTMLQPIQLFKISIDIVQCYMGFVHDEMLDRCECDPLYIKNDAIACDIINGIVCVKDGYWYGTADRTNEDEVYALDNCYDCDLRNYNSNDNSICKKDYHELPLLLSDQDDQCQYHRGGPFCYLCNHQSVFTYDAIRCVPRSSCQPWHVPILGVLYVCSWVLIITIFFFSLKLDFRIGTGYLYGILNYFTVIRYVAANEYKPLDILTNIIGSTIQLNPSPLGYLPLCSQYINLSRLEYEALHYINPLIMLVALFVIVKLAKWFKCFSLPHHSPEYGFCTIILLLFTSINDTSLSILRSYRYGSLTGTYVYIQPDVHYFDYSKHLPFAVIAILAEILFLVPFTLLLLLSPLLSKWINLIRIKPILDNFQYCFKDNMRWMAGFYFSGSLIFFMLNVISPINVVAILDISFLLNLLMLSFMSIVQPYKKQHLNYIDSLLLLNIVINVYFVRVLHTTPRSKTTYLKAIEIITYILVISAIIYTIVVIIKGIKQTLTKLDIHVSCGRLRHAKQKLSNVFKRKEDAQELPTQQFVIGEGKVRMFYPKKFRDSIFEVISDEDEAHQLTTSYSGQFFLEGLKKVFIRTKLVDASPPKHHTSTDVSIDD